MVCEYAKIADVTSRLVANPVSYRIKEARITEIVDRLAEISK